jgi:hypothetical protein
MKILDFFRKRPDDQVVVFAGNRIEAELVMNLLKEEGFHPCEWADMPAPYIGMAGLARIVVPPHEGEAAKRFLESLEE